MYNLYKSAIDGHFEHCQIFLTSSPILLLNETHNTFLLIVIVLSEILLLENPLWQVTGIDPRATMTEMNAYTTEPVQCPQTLYSTVNYNKCYATNVECAKQLY